MAVHYNSLLLPIFITFVIGEGLSKKTVENLVVGILSDVFHLSRLSRKAPSKVSKINEVYFGRFAKSTSL